MVEERRRKKDSAKLGWDTKPKRAPNPRDIEFQTAEVVIPNPKRDSGQIPLSFKDGIIGEEEIDKQKMNRLIWGDNLLAMQALLAQGYEEQINLIYIDPPFDSKADYSQRINIGDNDVIKEPSVIERLAYKDTWAGGIDSYLDMLYPRLQLIKRLLAGNGSIYLHLDWHVGHYAKVMLDEIFGPENFINEIVWQKIRSSKGQARSFGNVHDVIFAYAKSPIYIFNKQYKELDQARLRTHYKNRDDNGRIYQLCDLTQTGSGSSRKFGDLVIEPPHGKHWIWSQEKIDKAFEEGRIVFTSGKMPRLKRYLDESKGNPVEDIWSDIYPINSMALERTEFVTQKPEKLLGRIIKASSNEGDLIADFFLGSGTTCVVAENLKRRWIGCELGKVGIQISRARLVNMEAKPFLIENIGNYQREMIYLSGVKIPEMQKVVLKLYGATPRKGSADLGIRSSPKNEKQELVYVGYPDRPVTARKAEELARMAETLDGTGYKQLVILAWDYAYNYSTELENRKKATKKLWKTEIISRLIPPDVYEYLKKAKDEDEIEPLVGKVKFFEQPYLRLSKPEIKKVLNGWEVTIGIEKFTIFDFPVNQKDRENLMAVAKKKPLLLIDYWAVDWNYDGFTFKSQWQDFRGYGRKTKIVSSKTKNLYEKPDEYTIAVRVVDLFGNDASATMKVKLR